MSFDDYDSRANIAPDPADAKQRLTAHLDAFIVDDGWNEIDYEYEPEIVEDILPAVGVATVFGPSGVGKSFVCLDWAQSIARGQSVLGKDTESCGVVYCAFEGHRGLKRRIDGLKDQGIGNLPFRLVSSPWMFSQEGHFDHFSDFIESKAAEFEADDTHLGLVIIDTLTNATAGDDSHSQSHVSEMMHMLMMLAKRLKCLILLVGHTGKDASRGMAGSFAYKALSDAFIELRLEADESGAIARSVFIDKVKDGPQGYTAAAFDLEVIELTKKKPNGKALTTCRIEWRDAIEVQAVEQATTKLEDDAVRVRNFLEDGPKSKKEIAQFLALSPSYARKVILKMRENGWVYDRGNGSATKWILNTSQSLTGCAADD